MNRTSHRRIRIELQPTGKVLEVAVGTPLRNVLFEHGVEFPCGGRGRCRGCRVRALNGDLPVTAADQQTLTPQMIGEGWRLSCQAIAVSPMRLELAQWEAAILSDSSAFHFEPAEGLGIAIDLGTTTLCAQLLDRETGAILSVRSGLNRQARHGADLMSRIEFSMTARGGRERLSRMIHKQIASMIRELLVEAKAGARPVRKIVLAGNTVMHHFFCGIDVAPLATYPFEAKECGERRLAVNDLGWEIPGGPEILFLPCLGGFVGGDVLAGILAVGLHQSDAPVALVDLGTNGEIVLGNRERIYCTSTAAGPAFEGANISMGMRASTGAIYEARLNGAGIRCEVIGGGEARGLCGSGLVDVVAVALALGAIAPSGRITGKGADFPLSESVRLTQTDVRELQLAKAAIAAGISLLARDWGIEENAIDRVWLAGAFGNYIDRDSARSIGLLKFPPGKVEAAGNTALLGAKMALFRDDRWWEPIRAICTHICLSANPGFQEAYCHAMGFEK